MNEKLNVIEKTVAKPVNDENDENDSSDEEDKLATLPLTTLEQLEQLERDLKRDTMFNKLVIVYNFFITYHASICYLLGLHRYWGLKNWEKETPNTPWVTT